MVPRKYSTTIARSVRAKISHLANVEDASWMQDWPLEVANAKRVSEFLYLYQNEPLSSEEKQALMALIIYSFDEGDDENEHGWSQIRDILIAEAKLHAGLIVYWSCVCEGEAGDWCLEPTEHYFRVTPRMRTVLRRVRSEIGFSDALSSPLSKAVSAFREAHNIQIRTVSESEMADALKEILFGTKDILKALSMRIITVREARDRILFELELWLRARQPVPRLSVGDWVPPEVSAAIDGWLADWLQKREEHSGGP